MAAVTVASVRNNVNGAFREDYYTLTVVTTGDTLAVPNHVVRSMSCSDGGITKMTFASGTITFTGTAPAGTLVAVTGF